MTNDRANDLPTLSKFCGDKKPPDLPKSIPDEAPSINGIILGGILGIGIETKGWELNKETKYDTGVKMMHIIHIF